MKFYLSSFTIDALNKYVEIFPKEKLNILLSYGLRNGNYKPLFENGNVDSIIIDSGAYTLNFATDENLKSKISFGGYLKFLKYINYFYAFSYDADFDEGGWLNNIKYFDIARGKNSELVPVIHSYGVNEIDAYLEKGCEIIALGWSKYKKKEHISRCANYIYRHGAKVHLLGGTDYNILKDNPIDYGDSSSWVQHSTYGDVVYWKNGKKITFHFFDLRNSIKNSQKEIDSFSSYIKNETKGRLCYDDLKFKNPINRQVMNIRFFVNLQSLVTRYHQQNNILKPTEG